MLQSRTALKAHVVLVNDINETVKVRRSGGNGNISEVRRRQRPTQAAVRIADRINHVSCGDG